MKLICVEINLTFRFCWQAIRIGLILTFLIRLDAKGSFRMALSTQSRVCIEHAESRMRAYRVAYARIRGVCARRAGEIAWACMQRLSAPALHRSVAVHSAHERYSTAAMHACSHVRLTLLLLPALLGGANPARPAPHSNQAPEARTW